MDAKYVKILLHVLNVSLTIYKMIQLVFAILLLIVLIQHTQLISPLWINPQVLLQLPLHHHLTLDTEEKQTEMRIRETLNLEDLLSNLLNKFNKDFLN